MLHTCTWSQELVSFSGEKLNESLVCLTQEVESLQQSVIELKAKLHLTSGQLAISEREKSNEADRVLQLCSSVQQLTRYQPSSHTYILILPLSG